MNCLKTILTVFITGLSISLACAQSENNPPAEQNENYGKNYYFDSSDVARIAEIILENEMLSANQKLYREKDNRTAPETHDVSAR